MPAEIEPHFPILDEPMLAPAAPSYHLPPEDWNEMTDLAEHLSHRDMMSPLRRRMQTFLRDASLRG